LTVNEKVHLLRTRAGMTLDQLAKRCGMTKGYLSKLERNAQPPPLSTLQTIAQALGVELADFFADEAEAAVKDPHLDILRRDERRLTGREAARTSYGYSYAPLVESLRGKQMSPVLMVVQKGQTDAFHHDSEEFGYVAKGAVELHYEGKRHVLAAGDSFYFDSRKKHRFVNHQETPAVLVQVNYNYRRF
jgi:transcriptional regulator with XRE-family HTH domain